MLTTATESSNGAIEGTSTDEAGTGTPDARALRILAKSVYRELKSGGYSRGDIVSFTNSLLELVTTEMKDERVTPS